MRPITSSPQIRPRTRRLDASSGSVRQVPKKTVMRTNAVAAVCLAVLAAGCGAEPTQQSRPAEPSDRAAAATTRPGAVEDVPAALPRLARDLIPDSALRSLVPG